VLSDCFQKWEELRFDRKSSNFIGKCLRRKMTKKTSSPDFFAAVYQETIKTLEVDYTAFVGGGWG